MWSDGLDTAIRVMTSLLWDPQEGDFQISDRQRRGFSDFQERDCEINEKYPSIKDI